MGRTRLGSVSASPLSALVRRLVVVVSAVAVGVGGLGLATVGAQQEPSVGAGPLAGFSLVAVSGSWAAPLADGAEVVLPDPSWDYGLRADIASGRSVGSVRLELSGAVAVSRTENYSPYSLYGDYRSYGARAED